MQIKHNDFYFEKDGKPWLPVMGEMHYSRTERRHWKRSLATMKAAGVDIVATYVFWIHHEEIEGNYDFSGNKDLRAFVEEVKNAGMYLLLRIGPWAHGEARNGGFPDWLFDKAETNGFKLRRTNEQYLAEVEQYYKKIYEQVKGLLIEDGGSIIGIQVENEYNNICGGISGSEGDAHIRVLTNMLHKIGFNLPIETATGWGGAGTGDLIKVWGGYAARPWLPTIDELPPNPNYLFSFNRNDINIGAKELLKEQNVLYSDVDSMPYATAELGGGCQITDRRRPIVAGKDVAALVLSKIGSGANLVGFYMFHGGTNPRGILTTLEETPNRKGVTGCLSTLPKFSYDFQAPIGEYCQYHDSFFECRILLLMLRDFGEELCVMRTKLPEKLPKDEFDLETLRTAFRSNGKSGFLFLNNYQRRIPMAEHKDVILTAELDDEIVSFPKIDVNDGDFFVWPVNLPIGDGILKYATASPLCKLDGKTYVFYGDKEPIFEYAKKPINAEILWISRSEALKAQKVIIAGKEHLIISDATVLSMEDEIRIYSTEKPIIKVYPDFEKTPAGYKKIADDKEFAVYEKETYDEIKVKADYDLLSENADKKKYKIKLNYSGNLPDDIFLNIFFEGDYISVFVDGLLVTDNFYNADAFTVGLARYSYPNEIEVEIDTLKKDKQLYLQYDPRKDGKDACALLGFDIKVKQVSVLSFEEL